MITAIKNANYSFLFEEASKELLQLHNENKLGENALTQQELDYLEEHGRFTSLEQYFTRLGTLVAHAAHPIKYLMLPLDEPCVEVDANTRNITIPKEFKNGVVGVQGDVIAETLFLRVDRYFDAMDLLETEAYIQWKTKSGVEGASKIPYIDYESEHEKGKLILVWPLTGAITAEEGEVQFSLRFLKRKSGDVVYSWNSATATIKIQKALKSDFDYQELDNGALLFMQAIENSKHTSEKEDPDAPVFFEKRTVSEEANTIVHLNADNSLVLSGQASIADQGRLTYAWKYTDLEGNTYETPAVLDAHAAAFKATSDVNMDTEHNKVYYLQDDTAMPYGYKQIKNSDEFAAAIDRNDTIYERHAYYAIAPGIGPVAGKETVTGKYELIATNKLGFNSKETILTAHIPAPIEPVFTSGDDELGLSESGIFVVEGKFVSFNEADETVPAMIVSVENDDAPASAYQKMTYRWEKNDATADANAEGWEEFKTHEFDNEDQGLIGKKTDDLTDMTAVPGWYRVRVTSMLNRDSETVVSNVARVTELPVPPILKFPHNEETDNVDVVDADSVEFTDRQVKLVIETDPASYSTPTALYSDELIYEWLVDHEPIEEDDDRFSGVGTATLTIDGTKVQNQYMNIHCLVSNKLNGRVSTEASRSGVFLVNF